MSRSGKLFGKNCFLKKKPDRRQLFHSSGYRLTSCIPYFLKYVQVGDFFFSLLDQPNKKQHALLMKKTLLAGTESKEQESACNCKSSQSIGNTQTFFCNLNNSNETKKFWLKI